MSSIACTNSASLDDERNEISCFPTLVSAGGRPDMAYSVLSKVSTAATLIVGERDPLGIDLNNEAFAEITTEKHRTWRLY